MATGEGEGFRDASLEILSSYVEALPAGEPPRGDRAARRRRVVPALRAHAVREHVRVRRRRIVRRASLFVTAIGGAAAAVMLAAGPLARFGSPRAGATIAVLDGTLWLDEGSDRRALRAGEASGIEARDELEAPAERLARVQLADTATMTLAPAALVGTIVAAADAPDSAPTFEAVKLVRGRAHLQVHKLHGGQRFHVLTPDADVQVRGTEFDVELRPGMTPGTCVRVEEGLVAVVAAGATHLVGANQSWGCEVPVAAPAVVVAPPVIALPAPESHAASARARASDLRVQNTLFQTALEAERDGRYGAAAQLYRRLLARAPRGPLSAQARSNLAVVSRPR
jgi:FecR-like protein